MEIKNLWCNLFVIVAFTLIAMGILHCSNEEYLYKPENVPVVNVGNDTIISIKDTIVRDIIATDNDGSIEKLECKINEGDWTLLSSNQITIIAPDTHVVFLCTVKVTDDDGFISQDEFIVTIIIDKPICTALTITPTISINDTIRLQGTATDAYGAIVKWEWKFSSSAWIETSKGDTTIIAPSTGPQTYVCSLKVTDDDGLVGVDEIPINILGEIVDIDGNVYHTWKIGNQVWTVENLRVTHYNDGTPIPKNNVNSEWLNDKFGAYCYYYNDSTANAKKYGALYNWYAVNTGKLAPVGWHVPTDAEWNTLEAYLIINGYNWDGTTSGNKIGKSIAAKTDWKYSGNTGAVGNYMSTNNSCRFSALPGGYRYSNGNFSSQGNIGGWWSSTESGSWWAIYRYLSYNYGNLGRNEYGYGDGSSVRLLRD